MYKVQKAEDEIDILPDKAMRMNLLGISHVIQSRNKLVSIVSTGRQGRLHPIERFRRVTYSSVQTRQMHRYRVGTRLDTSSRSMFASLSLFVNEALTRLHIQPLELRTAKRMLTHQPLELQSTRDAAAGGDSPSGSPSVSSPASLSTAYSTFRTVPPRYQARL